MTAEELFAEELFFIVQDDDNFLDYVYKYNGHASVTFNKQAKFYICTWKKDMPLAIIPRLHEAIEAQTKEFKW